MTKTNEKKAVCLECKGKKYVVNPEYAQALTEEIDYQYDKAPSYAIAEIQAKKSVKVKEYITCSSCKGTGLDTNG